MEGFLDATSGSIFIEGHSLHSGMQGNAGLVGICPQHDLLWESLTGREHLLFYARLHAFKVSKCAHNKQVVGQYLHIVLGSRSGTQNRLWLGLDYAYHASPMQGAAGDGAEESCHRRAQICQFTGRQGWR